MSVKNTFLISVITATWNAGECIADLVDSIRNQTDKNFEWVVSDGLSTDATLDILSRINDINIKIISQKDFGIYDALNRGIEVSSGQYYLVVGADDKLSPNAISDLRKAIQNYPEADFITGSVLTAKGVSTVKSGPSWLYAQYAYVAQHAVGLLIKKDLHIKHGYYSKKFPIAADQYFILKSIKAGASVRKIDSVLGEFSTDGVSGIDKLGTMTESLRVQLLVGEKKTLVLLVFLIRLLKNIRRI